LGRSLYADYDLCELILWPPWAGARGTGRVVKGL
jgi:hypothetical protein